MAVFNDDEMRQVDCSGIELLLGRFHDGELEAGEAARVTAHLRKCESCAVALDNLRRLDSMLDLGLPEADLGERVLEGIGTRPAPTLWLTAAAAILPLALGAIAGSLLFNGSNGLERSGQTTASLIEESFGPGSLRGIDDLARDLDRREEGER
jgi:hypothetical protein